MITVISGVNRKGSKTKIFAHQYAALLREAGAEEVKFLALEDVNHDWFHAAMYGAADQSESLAKLQDEYILPASKLVFVMPEYNGSFPGVVKLFIDACSVREYQKNFVGKKAALIGVASGRAGNLRGLDHFADILNHVGTISFPNKLPISSIGELLNEDNEINAHTVQVMREHAVSFLKF